MKSIETFINQRICDNLVTHKEKCLECGNEVIPLKELVKDNFQEFSCPKCKCVFGIVHTPHNAYLITETNGKRRQICPICRKSLQS